MTSSVVGPRSSSKALPKVELAPKKGHGHCLVVCCLSDLLQLFWILAKPLHLRSMLSKLMRCPENCNDYSWHWSTEWAQFFSMTACYMTNALKSNILGYKVLPHLPFTWFLANRLPLRQASLQLFTGKLLLQPAGGRKCFPRVCWILKMNFYTTEINKHISCWQNCIACNGSYFD